MSVTRINPEYQPKGSYAGKAIDYNGVTDVKTLVEPGIYTFFAGYVSDAPTTSVPYWTVIVTCYGTDKWRIMQLALGCSDTTNAVQVYTRHSYYSSGQRLWTGWTKLHG